MKNKCVWVNNLLLVSIFLAAVNLSELFYECPVASIRSDLSIGTLGNLAPMEAAKRLKDSKNF